MKWLKFPDNIPHTVPINSTTAISESYLVVDAKGYRHYATMFSYLEGKLSWHSDAESDIPATHYLEVFNPDVEANSAIKLIDRIANMVEEDMLPQEFTLKPYHQQHNATILHKADQIRKLKHEYQ